MQNSSDISIRFSSGSLVVVFVICSFLSHLRHFSGLSISAYRVLAMLVAEAYRAGHTCRVTGYRVSGVEK